MWSLWWRYVPQAVFLPPVSVTTPICASFCWRPVTGAYITSFCATARDRQPILSAVKHGFLQLCSPPNNRTRAEEDIIGHE
ncbi:hypothetical protein BGW80DRAFT_1366013, partial [Lactifluus volemus]